MPMAAAQARRRGGHPWAYGAMGLYLAVALRDPQLLVA